MADVYRLSRKKPKTCFDVPSGLVPPNGRVDKLVLLMTRKESKQTKPRGKQQQQQQQQRCGGSTLSVERTRPRLCCDETAPILLDPIV